MLKYDVIRRTTMIILRFTKRLLTLYRRTKIKKEMKRLTEKEELIMRLFWAHGDMFIQDLLRYYPDPKPHHNTLATQLGILEEKGYVTRDKYANAYRYHAVLSEHDIADKAISDVVKEFYGSSYTHMVSRFVKEEKMDLAELKALIKEIENAQ